MASDKQHYNTTPLEGVELQEAIIKNGAQNGEVLKVFKDFPARQFTPREVHRKLKKKYEITSVRRAMTTLTTMGLLTRTTTKVLEQAGAKNFQWKLSDNLTQFVNK